MGKKYGAPLSLIEATIRGNDMRKTQMASRVLKSVDGIANPKIAIWGLAFKNGTDDVRESPAMQIVEQLLKNNAKLCVYDPKAMDNAKKILGNKKVILIVPEQSLPMDISKPSGVGQLNSKSTRDFIDFMKTYTGITTLKVLPQGELFPTKSGLYCNYSSSSMTIGSHSINLEELTTAEMGEILSKDTLKLAQNKFKNMALKNTADFENVIGAETIQNKALSEAYENLKTKDSPKIQELRQAFEKYKIENSIYLEKEALYETLAKIHNSTSYSDWPEQDKNLFNKNLISVEIRNNRINELKTKHAKEIDFVYFKQFLADEGLKKARLELNS